MNTLTQSLAFSRVDETDLHFLKEAQFDASQTTDIEVVLDFSAVRTINSKQLNDLIRFRIEISRRGQTLSLQNVPDHLIELFWVTRLDRLMNIRCAPSR